MNTIELSSILPTIFSTKSEVTSDIWQKEIIFEREKIYLINAPSGTGKSSLCSFICGFRDDYDGRIIFNADNIRLFSPKAWDEYRKKQLSIVFQDLKLFDELTAYENIQIKNKLTKHKSKKEIMQYLEFFELSDKVDTPVQFLSLGQKQRLAVIRAICQPFDFILLDEPISHLDQVNSDKVAQVILEEATKQKAGIIVTSLGNQLNLPYSSVYNL